METRSQKRRVNDDDADGSRFTKLQKTVIQPSIVTRVPDSIRGRRLLTSVLDECASGSPDRICAVIPQDDSALEAFDEISFGQLGNGVNRTALWLAEKTDHTPGMRLAYLGPSDVRYLLLLLAANKLGMAMLFPSPHNAKSTQDKLYEATECVRFLCAASYESLIVSFLGSASSSPIIVPEVRALLDPARVLFQGVEKVWDLERCKPFVILHTSGTTGMPKPIALPHSYYSCEDLSSSLPYAGALTTMVLPPGSRCLSLAPMWHAGGVFFSVLKPILSNIIAVFPPAALPMTPDLVRDCTLATKIDCLHSAPSIVDDMVTQRTFNDVLQGFKSIQIGSGPMAKLSGDALLGINPNTSHFFGSTETYLMPLLPLQDPVADWQYHHFHPLSGATFEGVQEGCFELVVMKIEGVAQPCFTIHPDIAKFHTKDVFSRHPSKSDLWKFECRVDDVITFETGEKLVATQLETKVASITGVRAALVVGQGRRRPALLLELEQGEAVVPTLDELWPEIAEVNIGLPQFGQLAKSRIGAAAAPFLRTSKGTVKRRATEEALRADVDRLYGQDQDLLPTATLTTSATVADISAFLETVTAKVLGTTAGKNEDLLSSAMDSFQIAQLVRSVNKGLTGSSDIAIASTRITPGVLYSHRSTSELAKRMKANIQDWKEERSSSHDLNRGIQTNHHKDILEQHRGRMPNQSRRTQVDSNLRSLQNTVLTGSTGNLGPHILHGLLTDDKVKRVTCLNRALDAEKQHKETFPNDEALLTKARFLATSNYNSPTLGLSNNDYESLLHSTTSIIHNAWPVNFHLPLQRTTEPSISMDTLDNHVGGIVSLINFTTAAKLQPQLIFISSLSAVIRSTSPSIPETVALDPSAPESSGYAQSKWLAENLLYSAVQSNSLRKVKIIRPGQISGPLPESSVSSHSPGGVWDPKQAIPSLVQSSNVIRVLPDTLGEKNRVRWIPVNVCARVIVEIAEEPNSRAGKDSDMGECKVYNVTNVSSDEDGREMTWTKDVLPVIKSLLNVEEIVSLKEWVGKVEEFGPRVENPAFKLLEFYEGLVESDEGAGLGANIDAERARAKSVTLRELGPVRKDWVEAWVKGWNLNGTEGRAAEEIQQQ